MNSAPHAQDQALRTAAVDERERLLLVEDSLFQAKLLQDLLHTVELDLLVEHAGTLAAARALLADVGSRVGCIVLDLTLPDASGVEGVAEMCAVAPETPLVVVTSTDDEALAIEAVRLGAQDYLIKGQIDPHLLRRAIRYAMDRKRSELLLADQALHDPLTGLPNRARFIERLDLALATSEREGSLVAVHLCDLNGFKAVNDALGHAAGDHLLQIVAQRLQSILRPEDMVARFGGDEFTLVSVRLDAEQQAVAIAGRVRGVISKPIKLTNRVASVSTCVGIALVSGASHPAEEVIAAADRAMYRAKTSGAEHELVKLRSPLARPAGYGMPPRCRRRPADA